MRSMTDEQLQAKYGYDKEPWLRPDGTRAATLDDAFEGIEDVPVLAPLNRPRPECIPSRYVLRADVTSDSYGPNGYPMVKVVIKRPPVNPILSDVRDYRAERLRMNNPKGWDHVLRQVEHAATANPWHATAEQIEHARKVLTRLANFSA